MGQNKSYIDSKDNLSNNLQIFYPLRKHVTTTERTLYSILLLLNQFFLNIDFGLFIFMHIKLSMSLLSYVLSSMKLQSKE